jgi:hypothetical protein
MLVSIEDLGSVSWPAEEAMMMQRPERAMMRGEQCRCDEDCWERDATMLGKYGIYGNNVGDACARSDSRFTKRLFLCLTKGWDVTLVVWCGMPSECGTKRTATNVCRSTANDSKAQ